MSTSLAHKFVAKKQRRKKWLVPFASTTLQWFAKCYLLFELYPICAMKLAC